MGNGISSSKDSAFPCSFKLGTGRNGSSQGDDKIDELGGELQVLRESVASQVETNLSSLREEDDRKWLCEGNLLCVSMYFFYFG